MGGGAAQAITLLAEKRLFASGNSRAVNKNGMICWLRERGTALITSSVGWANLECFVVWCCADVPRVAVTVMLYYSACSVAVFPGRF